MQNGEQCAEADPDKPGEAGKVPRGAVSGLLASEFLAPWRQAAIDSNVTLAGQATLQIWYLSFRSVGAVIRRQQEVDQAT